MMLNHQLSCPKTGATHGYAWLRMATHGATLWPVPGFLDGFVFRTADWRVGEFDEHYNSYNTQMLHGAGIFPYIYHKNMSQFCR